MFNQSLSDAINLTRAALASLRAGNAPLPPSPSILPPEHSPPPSDPSDTPPPSPQTFTPVERAEVADPSVWEVLAADLALNLYPDEYVAERYRLPLATLSATKANPFFARILAAKQEEVARLREEQQDAEFVLKQRYIVARATGEMLRRLTSGKASDKDFNALFRTAVHYAKLEPPTADAVLRAQTAAELQANQLQAQAQQTQIAIGTNATGSTQVVFNIAGVPGLTHLSTATPPADPDDLTLSEEPIDPDDDDL
jgi:hypothetical protein